MENQINMKITDLERSASPTLGSDWIFDSRGIEILMMFGHVFGTSDWAVIKQHLDSEIYVQLRMKCMPDHQIYQIQAVRKFLSKLIERIQGSIQQFQSEYSLYQEVKELLPYSHLELITDGASGSYFLIDQDGTTQFIIKPMDEGIHSLNNPKGLRIFSTDVRVIDSIPPYRTAEADMMAHLLMIEAGIPEVTPEVVIMMLDLDGFYDISQDYDVDPPADLKKLCSVQKFIPGAFSLFEFLHELQEKGLSDLEIAEQFDQDNYEMVMLFMWLIYETDGHMGNFLVIPQSDGRFKIMKIDNSLSFPDKHTEYRNSLRYLDNSKQPLSDKAKRIIANIPTHKIIDHFTVLNMDYAISPFMKRVALLRELAQQDNITIKMVDSAINKVNDEETITSCGSSTISSIRQRSCG